MASPKLEIREKGEKRDNHINVNVYILKESTWWRNSQTTITECGNQNGLNTRRTDPKEYIHDVRLNQTICIRCRGPPIQLI